MTTDGTQGAAYRPEQQNRCIARGTLVETPRGSRPVEQIRVGDPVWGFDIDRREPVVVKVMASDPTTANETITIGRLRVTTDHPVFVAGEWKPAGKLIHTDILLGSNLKTCEAGPVEIMPGSVHVYDIKVEPPENFFAGGILVHNKQ